jgi:hypothetical protein
VARDGKPHAIDVTVTASGTSTLVDPDRIDLTNGDMLTLDARGHTLRWTGRVGSDPAGFRFDPGATGPLAPLPAFEIHTQLDGQDVGAPAIYLAGGTSHPASSPFTYRRVPVLFGAETEEPPLLTSSAPNLSASRGEPVSVFVWRFPDDRNAIVAPPLDEAARQRLRALGYVE